MTGMKEGAGEDPFASSDPETDPDASDPDDNDPQADTETNTMTETTSAQPTEIPMILRRDSVQDGGDRVPLFLQQETKRDGPDALRELEARFDDNVSLTDLREALLLAGLADLKTVEETLREWGYGIMFE